MDDVGLATLWDEMRKDSQVAAEATELAAELCEKGAPGSREKYSLIILI